MPLALQRTLRVGKDTGETEDPWVGARRMGPPFLQLRLVANALVWRPPVNLLYAAVTRLFPFCHPSPPPPPGGLALLVQCSFPGLPPTYQYIYNPHLNLIAPALQRFLRLEVSRLQGPLPPTQSQPPGRQKHFPQGDPSPLAR